MTSPTMRPSNRLGKAIAGGVLLVLLGLGLRFAYIQATKYRPVEVPVTVVKPGTGPEVEGQGTIEIDLAMHLGSYDGPPHKQGKLSLKLELEGDSPFPGLRRMAKGARVGAVTRTIMTPDKVAGVAPNPVYPRPPVYLEMTIKDAFPSTLSMPPSKEPPQVTVLDKWKAQLALWAGGLQWRHVGGVVAGLALYFLAGGAVRRFFTKLPDFTPSPVRLLAVPTAPGVGWYHPDQVAEARAFFEEKDFEWVENVEIKPHKTLRACLLVDTDGVGVVIYDHEREGVWVDLMVQYNTMGGFMVSSANWAARLQQPPFCDKVILPGKPPAKLWSVFQEKISVPEDKWLELTPDNILWELERAYADEMDWRNAQQVVAGAPEAVVAEAGAPQPIPSTVGIQKAMANAGLLRGLRERFREAMPPEESLDYEVDDLAIVHRRLTVEDLIDYVAEHVDRPECEIIGLPEACGGKSPVEAFQALQDLLPAELRFVRVGSLDFPLPADFYRPPQGKIPISLFPHKKPEDK